MDITVFGTGTDDTRMFTQNTEPLWPLPPSPSFPCLQTPVYSSVNIPGNRTGPYWFFTWVFSDAPPLSFTNVLNLVRRLCEQQSCFLYLFKSLDSRLFSFILAILVLVALKLWRCFSSYNFKLYEYGHLLSYLESATLKWRHLPLPTVIFLGLHDGWEGVS